MSELNTPSAAHALARTLAAIDALDLEPIKFKAMRRDDGYGWSGAHAEAMAQAYKRYLKLHAMYPEVTLAPEQDIDRFWHMHILDTRKYAADCEATFGYFLHHYPYLGLRGAGDDVVLQQAYATMQALYEKEFGEPMPQAQASAAAWCGAETRAGAAWCGAEIGTERVAERGSKAAWCGVDAPRQPAWCGIDPGAQASAALRAPQ